MVSPLKIMATRLPTTTTWAIDCSSTSIPTSMRLRNSVAANRFLYGLYPR